MLLILSVGASVLSTEHSKIQGKCVVAMVVLCVSVGLSVLAANIKECPPPAHPVDYQKSLMSLSASLASQVIGLLAQLVGCFR